MSDEERTPPEKIRVTKLQEAQLHALHTIASQCMQTFYGAGFTEAQIKARTDIEIATLTRSHDVLVAEADHEPAGYLAWADQAPGVGYMAELMVAPEYQRFGVATRLLRELGEVTAKLGIAAVVTPCWIRAPWALAFLGVRGFQPLEIGGPLPDKLARWLKQDAGAQLLPGQKHWWAQTDGLGTVPGLPRPAQ